MSCKFIKNGKTYSTRTRAIRNVDVLDSYDNVLDRLIDNMDSDGFFFKDSFFQNDTIANIKNITFLVNDIFNKTRTLSSKRKAVKYFLDVMADKNIRALIKRNVQQRNKFAEDVVLDTINSLLNNENVSNYNKELIDIASGFIKMYNHINDDESINAALSQIAESEGIVIQKNTEEEIETIEDEEYSKTKPIQYNNPEVNTIMRNKYGSMDVINRFVNFMKYSLINANSPYGTTVSLESKDTLKEGIISIYENLKKGMIYDDDYFDGSTYSVIRDNQKKEVLIHEIQKEDILHPDVSNNTKFAFVLYNMLSQEYRNKDIKDISAEERRENEYELMHLMNLAFSKLNAEKIINGYLNGKDTVHAAAKEKYTDQYSPEDAVPVIFQQITGSIPMDINEPSKGFVPYSMVREIIYTYTLFTKAGRLEDRFDLRRFVEDLRRQLDGHLNPGEPKMFAYRDYKRKSAEAIVTFFNRGLDKDMLQYGVIDAGILWFTEQGNVEMVLGKKVDGEFSEGMISRSVFSEDAIENLRMQNRLKNKFSKKVDAIRSLVRAIENIYSNINEDPISYIDSTGKEQVQTYISKLRHTYEYRTNIEEYWGGKKYDNGEIGFMLKNNVFGENSKVMLTLDKDGKYENSVTIYTKKNGVETSYKITEDVPKTEAEFKEYVDNIKEGFKRLGFANIDTYFVEYLDRINDFDKRRNKLISWGAERNTLKVLQGITAMAHINYNTLNRSKELISKMETDIESLYLNDTYEAHESRMDNKIILDEINRIRDEERNRTKNIRITDYGYSYVSLGKDTGNNIYMYNAWQDKQFFSEYIESLYNFDNYIGNILGKTADGKYQSLINTATPYHLTTKTSNAIARAAGKQININGQKVSKFAFNLIKNGLIQFKNDALLDGGIEGSYKGLKQHELSTSDFINKMFNIEIKNTLLDKSFSAILDKERPAAMFTMTDMLGERKSMYKREWNWHGENPLYSVKLSYGTKVDVIKTLTRNEEELLSAYTAIAKHYELLQLEGLQLLKDAGLVIEDGFIKHNVQLEDGSIESRQIREEDSYIYKNLIKNHHFKTTTIDNQNYIVAGNIFTFENTPLPKQLLQSLIEGKATYDDVVRLYIKPQAVELAELLSDVKLAREFDEILNIEKAIKETNEILKPLQEKYPNLYPESREDYGNLIENVKRIRAEIANLDDDIKVVGNKVYETEAEVVVAQSLIEQNQLKKLVLQEEKQELQTKINNFKKIYAKTISKQTSSKLSSVKNENKTLNEDETSNDVNILLEYAINSFFLYNESVSQIVKGGSTYYSNLADEIKRGMGVSSPRLAFNSRDSRSIGSSLNVIYTTDVEGEMLGMVDSEAMTNGNVIVNPLTYERFLYTSGNEFAAFKSGQIKINIFDAGYRENDPGYIKMSAFTLRTHELKTRSKFYQDALRTFLDKDISIIKYSETVINGVRNIIETYDGTINLYKKFGKDILKARSDKELFSVYKKINDYLYNLMQGGYSFSEKQITQDDLGENNNIIFNKNLYELLPHMIAPISTAKTFAKNIIPMVKMDMDNSKFSSTLPSNTGDGLALNNLGNMSSLNSANLGIQGNKQHDILSDKTIPIQILNFISAIDKDAFVNISNSLSNIINKNVDKLEALYLKGDYQGIINEYRNIAYYGKLTQEKSAMVTSLFANSSINNDVINSDIIRSMMVDINNINKPSMPGSSFVQIPAAYNLYFDKETGQAYYASEVGMDNDQIDDMSQDLTEEQITVDEEGNEIKTNIASKGNKYDRRKLKPFSFYVNGKQVMTKEELLDLIENDADIKIRHQEVIMDFPYRKEFYLSKYASLDSATRFNGFSFLYPIDVSHDKTARREIVKRTVNEFIKEGDSIETIIDNFKTSKGLKKELSKLQSIDEIKIKLEEYFYNLNEALFIYPLRIPTTNMSSGFPSRIVAFAHGIENSLIIPAEKSILDGSDFDIDELHTFYKPIIKDGSILIDEDLFFETIISSYFKKENIKYIIQEISYKSIVKDTNQLNDEADRDKGVYSSSIINMLTAREKMLVGKSMVGFKVNEQQGSLLTSAMSAINEDNVLPILSEKDGLLKMVDIYSAYVNLATDNGKLDGVLGRLKHNTAFIQLEIGLIGKGLGLQEDELSKLSGDEYKTKINRKLHDIYSSELMRNVVQKYTSSNSILNNKYYKDFESVLLSEINKIKEGDKEYELSREIYDALVLGTAIGRLYQFNLTRGVKTSDFDAYKLYMDLSYNLGMDLSQFIQTPKDFNIDAESQLKFLNEVGDEFENNVRTKINIPKYVQSNSMMFSQLKLFTILYDTANKESKKSEIFNNLNELYKQFKKVKSFSAGILNEQKFKQMMNSAESILITNFIQNSKINNGKISLTINSNSAINDVQNIEYDLSNYNDLMAFLSDFPEYVNWIKSEHKYKQDTSLNIFVDKLTVKRFSDGSYEVKIKNSENIDDDAFVDDYAMNFKALPDNVKQAFRIFGLLHNGFDIRKNSLTRFMDEDILLEYSDFMKNSNEINITDNLYYASIMKHLDLQYGNQDGKRFGYSGSAKKHSLFYGATFVKNNDIKVLKTFPNTFLLSNDSIVTNNTFFRFTPEQERMLKDGISFTFKSDFVIKEFRQNNSNPIEVDARGIPDTRTNINYSLYNMFKLNMVGSNEYSVLPVSKQTNVVVENKNENISFSGVELVGYFDSIVNDYFNENVKYNTSINPLVKNETLHLGSDNQIILTHIVNKPEILLFLKSNNRNNYYADFMKNIQDTISKEDFYNSLTTILKESKLTVMEFAALVLRHNTNKSFKNLLISQSNGITRELNTVLKTVTDSLFDSANAFILNAQTSMINEMSNQLLQVSYDKLINMVGKNKLRLFDIIQEKVNSDYVINNDIDNNLAITPTVDIIALKNEINKSSKDIDNIKCTLINK